MNQSPTPRTDAERVLCNHGIERVTSELCAQIERELHATIVERNNARRLLELNAKIEAEFVDGSPEKAVAEICNQRAQIITLESSLRDYREAVSQAQDALGEFWVTTPTLPAACRALYAEFAKMRTDLAFIREILARADHTVSDDPVEGVGQLVDELRKRGWKIRTLEDIAEQERNDGRGNAEESSARS